MFGNRRLERRIDRLERKLDLILEHLGVPAPAALPGQPDIDYSRIDEFLLQGKKIHAIKVYRELIPHAGLAEAKQAVEDRERRYG